MVSKLPFSPLTRYEYNKFIFYFSSSNNSTLFENEYSTDFILCFQNKSERIPSF